MMSANSNTILLVEDDEQTVALINHIFGHSCTNVVSLASNKLCQLNKLIQNHHPTLIILDYMSIRRDYDTTLVHLKSFVPMIPTVIMTTIDDDTLSASFDYTIRKPFYKADIFMIMQDAVQRSL